MCLYTHQHSRDVFVYAPTQSQQTLQCIKVQGYKYGTPQYTFWNLTNTSSLKVYWGVKIHFSQFEIIAKSVLRRTRWCVCTRTNTVWCVCIHTNTVWCVCTRKTTEYDVFVYARTQSQQTLKWVKVQRCICGTPQYTYLHTHQHTLTNPT